MYRMGLEITIGGKESVLMFDSEEAARKHAEELAPKLVAKFDTILLFSVYCNEDGKIASNAIRVKDSWGSRR